MDCHHSLAKKLLTTSTISSSESCFLFASTSTSPNSRVFLLPVSLSSSLAYDEVKFQALMACKNLESKGTITRSDGYQEILNSIANDIRTKNRKQIQRAKDLKSMQNALDHLEEKKTGLEEQIQMYKTHNAQSISNMQDKG